LSAVLLPNGEIARPVPAPLPVSALQRVITATCGSATGEAVFAEPTLHLDDRVAERGFQVERQRQENLESIFRLAAQCPVEDGAKPGAPDSGWLGLFIEGAQDAVQELEQGIWARWLAAEIASPGTISRRSLAFLRTLNAWELESFHEYGAFAFAFESGWRFLFEDERARREIWTYGREIDLTTHWVDIGLLSAEVSTLIGGKSRGLRIVYRQRIWQLTAIDQEPAPAEPVATATGLAYRKFTAIGQQLADAMTFKTFNGYARNVIKALQGTGGLGFDEVEAPDQAGMNS
jgi:hypothetical protein